MSDLISVEIIERKIYLIRGMRVMLDSDLALLYEVETAALNRAVKRNPDRFPEDFMFQLTDEESVSLRCQIGISKSEGRGGRRYLSYVFTEQGIAMLSSVLTSKRALSVNIAIMRTFVKLRDMLLTHKDLARKPASANQRASQQAQTSEQTCNSKAACFLSLFRDLPACQLTARIRYFFVFVCPPSACLRLPLVFAGIRLPACFSRFSPASLPLAACISCILRGPA